MIKRLSYMKTRRRALQQALDLDRDFDTWEETCVPSYAHRNLLAAYTSWSRLFKTAEIAERLLPNDAAVLDFGSGIAELRPLLSPATRYSYIEELKTSVDWISRHYPRALRSTLEDPERHDAVFALDSLEHNDDYRQIVKRLIDRLRDDGVFIVSGPTENWLYRLGRRVAGFSGHYHKTTIHDIGAFIDGELQLIERHSVPFFAPLFVVSAWRRR